jgi:predicted nucleic acid-binding Zn ribbon protein
LQNEARRAQAMGRIMLLFVIGIVVMMLLVVLFGLHII